MSDASTLTHVHTPIRLGAVEVKNRVVRPAHQTQMPHLGNVTEQLIAYHEARARGGVGLTILETMGIHQTSPGTLWGFHPDMENSYPRMMERLQRHGMKVFQQLWHAGHNIRPLDDSPPWSASDQPSTELMPLYPNGVPIAMTKPMIDEIVEAYANTARNCEKWGGDGVEVHAAHGYLPAQFLSTATNHRDDDYGGPFENRVRFLIEVLEAIRAAVTSNFAVCVRLSPEDIAGGLGPEELHRTAALIESKGLADVFNLSMGNYQSIRKTIGAMHEPVFYELPSSLPIREGLETPVIMIGRIRTLEEADQLIRNGDCDMVAMNRATMADPDLVNKTLAGKFEQVRPCIACNQGCLGMETGQGTIVCAVNAGSGREGQIGDHLLTPAEAPRKVLVIGGGPAGIEAARVAATRGHKVTLVEARPNLGGTINLAGMAPTRAGIRDIVVWLEEEIYRLGVDVELSTYVEADDIAAYGADAVIVATGATPRLDGLQVSNPGEPTEGMDQPHVISSNGLFEGERRDLGDSAVVVDDVGHYEAVAVADHLISKGLKVSFVTRHYAFAPRAEPFLVNEAALQRLNRGQFRLLSRTRAVSVEKDGVVVAPTYGPADSNVSEKLPADTVVFVSNNRPNRGLYEELKAMGVDAHVIGDANSPRFLTYATLEGHRAGVAV
jgi:2,4-dienoyl-CoA reductase-like NADH-dependent reductase (Old Yellow Enzyme family)/thioredoxin reductase